MSEQGAAENVSVAVTAKDVLGEGPCWDDRTNRLSWVDIKARRIRRWAPGESAPVDLAVADEPSLALPRAAGGQVVTQVDRIDLVDEGGVPRRLCPVDPDNPHTRLNDGCCDDDGRLWVGTYSTRGEPEAALYLVDPQGVVRQMLSGLMAANGVGWSPSGEVLHVTDTGRCRIDSYVLGRADGSGEPRLEPCGVVMAEDGSRGRPDGLTVDREGSIWVVMWGGGQLRRYRPDGTLLAEIPLPVTYPTSVALGGADRRSLFVTTSRHHLADPASEPYAGSLLTRRTDVPGLPTRRFGG